MSNLLPIGDRVIVKRIDAPDKTEGGIFIPENAKEKPQRGKVLAVGEGRWVEGELKPLLVRMGEEILFGKYSGTEIEIDGEETLIIREEDILAKVIN